MLIAGIYFSGGFVAIPTNAQDASPPIIEHKERFDRGASIYKSQCANCHGEQGQGVKDAYAEALTGDASLGELTKVIHDTMPDGEPEKCVGPDAEAVAYYIYESFYGPAAQVRNRPARIGLARLTANQLRNSLADLYAHFGGIASSVDKRGLKGTYFDGDRFKKENLKIDRIDPVLQFDFCRESPGEGMSAESFYILWEGSLRVPQTGRYEIIVRSTCSFKMDFGKSDRLFIDNHVQSGDKIEFRQPITLMAGRLYPIKIDFIQRKRKTELPPARISLSWVTPDGVEQIIPNQCLLPTTGPGTFALQTSLPADDRSYGFERGIAINRQWDDSTTAAALEFARIAQTELLSRYLRNNKDKPNENRALLRAFLKQVIEVAFRGPIDGETQQRYIDHQIDITEDDGEALKRVLLLALKSPRFLYPLADVERSSSQRAANRLALVLFDSLPSDNWLMDRIKSDRLQTLDQKREAATKMVSDERAMAKIRDMLHEWLNISQPKEITKDLKSFAGFDAELVHDLNVSLDLFLDDVVSGPESDYRKFFKSQWAYTSPRIEDFYGTSWKPDDATHTARRIVVGQLEPQGFRKTAENAARFGLLTHPYLMSRFAYHDSSSPIHRGIFLIRYMLGRTLRPPADAFAPLSPDLHPDLTTRERVALQTSPDSCQICHSKINSLGFALENYDAVGRYRETERNKPIDSSGRYRSRSDADITFQNTSELADYLCESPDAHRAFVHRAFQYFVKQPPEAYGPETLEKLTDKFKASGYNIRQLVIEIALIATQVADQKSNPQES